MTERVFKRKIYDQILCWKNENNGKSALLIEGARRVGKSTIVEDFARREYKSYILIDFNKASNEIKGLFDDLMDLDFIFLRLQTIYKKKLEVRNSVIIFDEVQKCPNARQAIKYLVEDGRYDYIETGSLISIKKNTENITIPSEEDKLQMHPMDYEEFRWAMGDEVSIPMLRTFWEKRIPLQSAHREAQRNLRLYMLIGGMPQAVNAYLDTNNFGKVDAVKRKIVQLYADDFLKIDPSGKATLMFLSIPSALSNNKNRYTTTSIIGNVDENKRVELLKALEDSKCVNLAYHANDPNVGMPIATNFDKFKMYVADTGLMVTMAFWDKDYAENVIYEKLLGDKLDANLGYIYENIIAQMLTASGNKLFYHTWNKKKEDGSIDDKHTYEIDFILSRGHKVCPIEVKSSGYKRHTSLDDFCKKYSSRILNRYLVYTKDMAKEEQILYVPVYLTPFL
ncbi:MAG: AAA family ATPase [Prevotellaceae bacterium]|nr:AAA family ATPase [Prevotellaceae bacterium]